MFVPLHDENVLKSISFPYVTVGLIITNVIVFVFEVMGLSEAVIASFAIVPAELVSTAGMLGSGEMPFFKLSNGKRRALIFTDPFTFIDRSRAGLAAGADQNADILALFQPNTKTIDRFLGENPNIHELQFVLPASEKSRKEQDLFFGQLKTKYKELGVSLDRTAFEPKHLARDHELSPI